MGVLIDASILIDHERGRLDIRKHVAERENEPFFLSVITVSELLHGVHGAGSRSVRARRSAFVEGVLGSFPVLPIEVATSRMHAGLWADLAAEGRVVGPHDLWLAASCLTHGLSLATSNVREFNRVPGLDVEDWSSPPAR